MLKDVLSQSTYYRITKEGNGRDSQVNFDVLQHILSFMISVLGHVGLGESTFHLRDLSIFCLDAIGMLRKSHDRLVHMTIQSIQFSTSQHKLESPVHVGIVALESYSL